MSGCAGAVRGDKLGAMRTLLFLSTLSLALLSAGVLDGQAGGPSQAEFASNPPAPRQQVGRAQGRRVAVRGSVRDRSGASVAGADVELWLRPGTIDASFGIADTVRVRSDARGRFRARVLDGYSYSAAASWKESGQRRASEIVARVRAGEVLRLVENEGFLPERSFRIRIRNFREAQIARFELRLWVDGQNVRELFACEVEHNVAKAVTLPFGGKQLRYAYYGDGIFLFGGGVGLTKDQYSSASMSKPLRFRVCDSGGNAIAGARIEQRTGCRSGSWQLAARSDAEGEAVLRVSDRVSRSLIFRVRAPGYLSSLGRWAVGMQRLELEGERLMRVKVAKITLRKGRGFELRLRGFDGKPAPSGWQVALGQDLVVRRSIARSPLSFGHVLATRPTDSGGVLRAPAFFGDDHKVDVTAYATPEMLEQLRSRLGAHPLPSPRLRLAQIAKPSGKVEAIDLSKAVLQRVTVLARDRSPVNGAALVRARDVSRAGFLEAASRSDRLGRLAWLEMPDLKGKDYFLFKERVAWAHVAVAGADSSKSEAPEVVLQALDKRVLEVVDAEGQPVDGAVVSIAGCQWTGRGALLIFAEHVNARGLLGRSGKDGKVELQFIAEAGIRYTMRVRKGSQSVTLPLPKNADAPARVVLEGR